MNYYYLIYGLKVKSFIKLPECLETPESNDIDVTVKKGEFPKEFTDYAKEKTNSDFFVFSSKTGAAYRIPNVADYFTSANEIIVRPIADESSQEIKTFLLGSSFGYCMILRQKVALHGGAVSSNNLGIIVTGESGAGKSTITNALRENGYSFIADDVCALSDNGNFLHIDMAYPQQKLCRDAALKMGYDLSELIYINEDRDKFAVRLKDNYLPNGMDFNLLFEIVLSEDDKLTFRKITGHEALMLIIRNIYRGEGSFNTWGFPVDYMHTCLKIAKTVDIYQISRPQNLNTLPEIINFIKSKVFER